MALDRLVFGRLGYPDLPESFFRDVDLAFRQRSAFHVFPDVIPALRAMRAAGLRLAVVSNWGWAAPELLQTLELAQHFEVLSISARVGYQKPHPAIFEHALELLGVEAGQAIHVGDDPKADVMGARRAGIEPDPRGPPRPGAPAHRRRHTRRWRDGHRRPHGAARPARDRAAGRIGRSTRLNAAPPLDLHATDRWRLFISLPLPTEARRSLWAQLAPYRERHRADALAAAGDLAPDAPVPRIGARRTRR